jgi:hypothetical protein
MEKRERATCPECDAELTVEKLDSMPVAPDDSAFVCRACETVTGFG